MGIQVEIKVIVTKEQSAATQKLTEVNTRVDTKQDGEFQQRKSCIKVYEGVFAPGEHEREASALKEYAAALVRAQLIADALDGHWKDIIAIITKTPEAPF